MRSRMVQGVSAMRLELGSVRGKMLVPAAVAIASTVVATMVTMALSRQAAIGLARVTRSDFPSLQLYQDVRRKLEELHTELLVAAMGGDQDQVGVADGGHDELIRMLRDDGPATVGMPLAESLAAEVDAYYAVARLDALGQAAAAQRAKRGEARPVDDLKAAANAEAAAGLYNKLLGRIDTEAHSARELIEQRFGEVRRWQWLSVLMGALIVLGAGAASGALAWWLSGRTARPLRALAELTTRIADGDLTLEVPSYSRDEVGALADGFRRMVASLRKIVSTLQSTSEELGAAAERLGDATQAQSELLERQASGVAETTSTTRELEQTAALAAGRAAAALEVARRAAEMSDGGRGSAERSAEELKRIQESIQAIVGQSGQLLERARQVDDIVATVRDLADQSHVLSLNASIEAARAGDAGRGFAVVAQEVRALAEKSGKGAGRIAGMVQEIMSAVNATRELTSRGSDAMAGSLDQIRASGESLREIGETVRESSDAIQQIARAVQEQSTGIGQISGAMRDLDRGMEDTVGRIRSLSEAVEQVAETAVRISGVADAFRV